MSRLYKNKRLRKSPIVTERVSLINKVITETLNESFESIIETNFKIIEEGDITIYRFKTNSGNEYDLEFIFDTTKCDTPIEGGLYLDRLTKTQNIGGFCRIPTVDIAFVPSEINLSDRENPELYTKETNRGEQFELMGRISYLVKQYLKNNPQQKVFIIGKNTKETKLKIYETIYNNIFSSEFIKVEGQNEGYPEGCVYFIKKY